MATNLGLKVRPPHSTVKCDHCCFLDSLHIALNELRVMYDLAAALQSFMTHVCMQAFLVSVLVAG